MFFGREDVFEFVRQTLIGQHQDNIIVLHGQRRTGKTSALYQIHRHIDPKYVPILIDLQALTMEGTATFLWELATSISRTLRRDHDVDVGRPRQEDFTKNPREFFQDNFLENVFDNIGDRNLLLMFDESVRLEDQVLEGRLERDIFDYLRYLMQHMERMSFIFSLGSRLEEMHREYGVLFSVALYKKITFLDKDSARRLVTDPVKGIYEYDDEAVEYILEAGGRHPYYTQVICHSVFSRYAGTAPVITSQEVVDILPEAVERCTAVLKFVWDQSSDPEMLILSAMADWMSDNNQPMTEARIRQALEDRQIALPEREINTAIRGLVDKEALIQDDGYKFPVDLLRLYLRENHKVEWCRVSA